MYKNPIIVFEGIEGSGKSLHINNVSNYLKKKKRKFIKIREPGGSLNSEKIRKLILNNDSNFNSITDLLLYFASRSENIDQIIKKNYGKKIILIDRFIDSTIAYQHYGMGINIKFIKSINNFLMNNIRVNFTFLNLVSKKNLQIRLSKRKNLNRYDKFSSSFYDKVQKGFIKIANKDKDKYLKINSNLEINLNKKKIIEKLEKLI
jgi:dTMP kinase|tara:strand:+ start:105 stop:719 length:615 start_codon:yes stop_codon:yes gene_type:complete